MDSCAVYVTATSRLASDGDFRWQLAHHEREAFADIGSKVMRWQWCDAITRDPIAPAFSEPPKLPNFSQWMPSGSGRSWEDVASSPGIDQRRLNHFRQSMADSVVVYQFA
jgi:hypothetical protein